MKDPAFLFYSSDFLSGTMLMSDEQIGQYIKLLCLQHQKGHLKEKDMLNICKTHDEDIFSKFKKDEQGNYYNERLEEEVLRRKKYSESRRNNRKKKDLEENKNETYEEDMKNICNSYEEHMETETITINENINEKEDKRGMGEEEEKNKPKKKFVPPTLEDVEKYVIDRGLKVDAKHFYDYFSEGNWIDSNGNQVRNWKQKILTWDSYPTTTKKEDKKRPQNVANFEARHYSQQEYDSLYANS